MTNEEIVSKIHDGEDPEYYLSMLWEHNEKLVMYVIRHTFGPEYSKDDDLKQEGFIALVKAAKRYQPEIGCLFSSYAVPVIRRELTRYVDNCGSTVRVPENLKRIIYRYEKYIKEYSTEYGVFPKDTEIKAALSITDETLEWIRRTVHCMNIKSLDETINAEQDSSVLMEFIDAGIDIEDLVFQSVFQEELHKELNTAIGILKPQTQTFIRAAYYHQMSYKQVARLFGCSYQNVSAAIRNGFWKILHSTHVQSLLEFMPEGYRVKDGLFDNYMDYEKLQKLEQNNKYLL